MKHQKGFIFRSFENVTADVFRLSNSSESPKAIKVGSITSYTTNDNVLLKQAKLAFPKFSDLSIFNVKSEKLTYKMSKDDFIKNGEKVISSENKGDNE